MEYRLTSEERGERSAYLARHPREYVQHIDPGHSWLAVKRAELAELGILAQISAYSYQRGGTVYLEEDIDAGLFVDAYRVAHGRGPTVRETYSDGPARVRGYEGFRHYPVQS